MKKILSFVLIFSIIALFSCNEKLKKVTKETYPDGKPKLVQYFSNDNNEVLVKETQYHANQKKKMEGGFANQKREGLWTAWFEDGKKWSEGYFKNGLNDSTRTVWHPNGNKYYEGHYKDGAKVGIWKFWDEKGTFVKEVDYSKMGKDTIEVR
jgi:antitoxin component YwqK of YwqJK toxin-antitoxin module